MCRCSTVMFGSASTAANNVRSISRPVVSWKWRTRRLECPPSRPRSSSVVPFPSGISRSSKCTPSEISSRMRAGPSLTMVRTAASSHSPAPASSVSSTCESTVSSLLQTHATPPCAQAVLESAGARLVTMATRPCAAAFSAKVSPATPLPMTIKSKLCIKFHASERRLTGLLATILSMRRVRPKKTATANTAGFAIRLIGCRVSASVTSA